VTAADRQPQGTGSRRDVRRSTGLGNSALIATIVATAFGVVVLLAVSRDEQRAPEPARAGELPPDEASATAGSAAEALRDPAVLRRRDGDPVRLGAGALEAIVGQRVRGEDLLVLGLEQGGFFAGSSELDRFYVSWTGDPPPFRTRVDVRGVVRPFSARYDGLGLARSAELVVEAQGGYVLANEVLPAA
jgi:hypothetical protein